MVVEEAWVVTADGDLQAVVHKVADWVVSKVKGVAKDHVAQRAALDADVTLDDFLYKVGE